MTASNLRASQRPAIQIKQGALYEHVLALICLNQALLHIRRLEEVLNSQHQPAADAREGRELIHKIETTISRLMAAIKAAA